MSKMTLEELLKEMLAGKSFYNMINWTRFMRREETALVVVDAQNDILKEHGTSHRRETALRTLSGWSWPVERRVLQQAA